MRLRRAQHFRGTPPRPKTKPPHGRTSRKDAQKAHPYSSTLTPLQEEQVDEEGGERQEIGSTLLTSSYPAQCMLEASPTRTNASTNRLYAVLAVVGAFLIVALYLVIPLMIFFGFFHDWLAQLLSALVVLTLCEYGIYRIVAKTTRAMPPPIAKAAEGGAMQRPSGVVSTNPARSVALPDLLTSHALQRTTRS